MIVAHRKNIGELKKELAGYRKLLVLGCGTCVTVCLAGGEREVGMISSALRIAYRLDNQEHEIKELTIERQCENQFMEDIIEDVRQADAVLSLACGAGVQAMAERFPGKPVYAGLDTKFIGILQEQGIWTEKCVACGKCLLGAYGAVCPLTRCSRGCGTDRVATPMTASVRSRRTLSVAGSSSTTVSRRSANSTSCGNSRP